MANVVNLAQLAKTKAEAVSMYNSVARLRVTARVNKLPQEAERFNLQMQLMLPTIQKWP